MTKFRICSDLHLERLTYKSIVDYSNRNYNSYSILEKQENEKEQILLLVGDICEANALQSHIFFFEEISNRFKHVFYVMGNHEHWHHDVTYTEQKIKDFLNQFNNITLLEKECTFIEDIAIFGATLWSNFNNNPMIEWQCRNDIGDFKTIKIDGNKSFLTGHCIQQYEQTIDKLKEFIDIKHDKKIVMTHFAPSHRSIHKRYKTEIMSPYWCNNIDDLIRKSGILYFCHGHTHNSFKYKIGKTQVICNPVGYGLRENKQFKKNLVIEI